MADLAQLNIPVSSTGIEQTISALGQAARALGSAESATQKMVRELETLQRSFQGMNTGAVNSLVDSLNRINGAVHNMSISGSTANLDSFIQKLSAAGDGSGRAASKIAEAGRAVQNMKELFVNLNTGNLEQFNTNLAALEQRLLAITAARRHASGSETIFSPSAVKEVQDLITYLKQSAQEVENFKTKWNESRQVIPLKLDRFTEMSHEAFVKIADDAKALEEKIAGMKFGVQNLTGPSNGQPIQSVKASGNVEAGLISKSMNVEVDNVEKAFSRLPLIVSKHLEKAQTNLKNFAQGSYTMMGFANGGGVFKEISKGLEETANKSGMTTGPLQTVQGNLKALAASGKASTDALTGFGEAFLKIAKYTTAFQLFQLLQQLPAQIYESNVKMEALAKSFEGAFGGASKGAQELEYAIATADKYGKSIESVANSYKRFAITSEYMGMSTEVTRNIFESVTKAITKVGGGSEDVSGTLTALIQMMSKGTVSAEEFRLQFAERIPGAMKMGADALGVTTAQFKKMMAEGQIVSSEFIPKLAAQLNKFSQGWEASTDTIQANSERLKNSLDKTFSSGTLQNFANEWIKTITAVSDKLGEMFDAIGARSKGKSLVEQGILSQEQLDSMSQTDLVSWIKNYEDSLSSLDAKIEDVRKRLAYLHKEDFQLFSGGAVYNKNQDVIDDLEKQFEALNNKKMLEPLIKQFEELAKVRAENAKQGIFDPSVEAQLEAVIRKMQEVKGFDGSQVRMTLSADTSALDTALGKIRSLYAATKEAKIDSAQAELDSLNSQKQMLAKGIGSAEDGSGGVRGKIGVPGSKETVTELKNLETVIREKEVALDKLRQTVAKGETTSHEKLMVMTVPGKNGTLENLRAIEQKYGDMKKEREAYFEATKKTPEDSAKLKQELDHIEKMREGARQVELSKNASGAAGATKHANAVDKLNTSLDNYLEKEMGLAGNDSLGAAFASAAEKANQLQAKVKDLAIKGGISVEETTQKIQKLEATMRGRAVDKEISSLFPWLKKDDKLQGFFTDFYQHTEEMKQGADRAGISMEYIWEMLVKMSTQLPNVQALAKAMQELEVEPDLAKWGDTYERIAKIKTESGGEAEKELFKEIEDAFITSSDSMASAREEMYARVIAAAEGSAEKEKIAAAFVQKDREDNALKDLKVLQQIGTSSEAYLASLSESMGLYKSEATRARESSVEFGKDTTQALDGLSDSMSTGITDALSGLIRGTTSAQDAFKAMLDSMMDMLMNMLQKMIKYALDHYVIIPIMESFVGGGGSKGGSGGMLSNLIGNSSGGSSSNPLSFLGDISGDLKGSVTDGLKSSFTDFFSTGGSSSLGNIISSSGVFDAASYGLGSTSFIGDLSSITGPFAGGAFNATSSTVSTLPGVAAAVPTAASEAALATGTAAAGTAAAAGATALSGLATAGIGLLIGGAAMGLGALLGGDDKKKKKEPTVLYEGTLSAYSNGTAMTAPMTVMSDGTMKTKTINPQDIQQTQEAFKDLIDTVEGAAKVLKIDLVENFATSFTFISGIVSDELAESVNWAMQDKLGKSALGDLSNAVMFFSDGMQNVVEVFTDLAEAAGTVKGSIEALGIDFTKFAAIDDKYIETIANFAIKGTGDLSNAFGSVSQSAMSASEYISKYSKELRTLAEAQMAKLYQDALGGEDKFNSAMQTYATYGITTKEQKESAVSYYGQELRGLLKEFGSDFSAALGDFGQAAINVDNIESFWSAYNAAMQQSMSPSMLAAWAEMASYAQLISSTSEELEEVNLKEKQWVSDLKYRKQLAEGLEQEAEITKLLAGYEQELAQARADDMTYSQQAELVRVEIAELQKKYKDMTGESAKNVDTFSGALEALSDTLEHTIDVLSEVSSTASSLSSTWEGISDALDSAIESMKEEVEMDYTSVIQSRMENLEKAYSKGMAGDSESMTNVAEYATSAWEAVKKGATTPEQYDTAYWTIQNRLANAKAESSGMSEYESTIATLTKSLVDIAQEISDELKDEDKDAAFLEQSDLLYSYIEKFQSYVDLYKAGRITDDKFAESMQAISGNISNWIGNFVSENATIAADQVRTLVTESEFIKAAIEEGSSLTADQLIALYNSNDKIGASTVEAILGSSSFLEKLMSGNLELSGLSEQQAGILSSALSAMEKVGTYTGSSLTYSDMANYYLAKISDGIVVSGWTDLITTITTGQESTVKSITDAIASLEETLADLLTKAANQDSTSSAQSNYFKSIQEQLYKQTQIELYTAQLQEAKNTAAGYQNYAAMALMSGGMMGMMVGMQWMQKYNDMQVEIANLQNQLDYWNNYQPTAMAVGGIVTSPTLAYIGEGGESEAVIPLSQLDRIINTSSEEPSSSEEVGELKILLTEILQEMRSNTKVTQVVADRVYDRDKDKGFALVR